MRTVVILSAATFLCRLSFADITQLPPETRSVLRDVRRFVAVASVRELPASIRAIAADHDGRLAGPGEPFEAGAPRLGPSVPSSRLRWAVRSPDGTLFLFHYERGGVGLAADVVVAAFDPRTKRSKIRWSAVGDRFADHRAFARALGGQPDLYDHAPYFTH